MRICVCLDVQVHRRDCRQGSNVHTEVDSHTRNPLCLYWFTQHPIGVPGCLVCSLNARSRSSCTYGRSLSCLLAFTWTYRCIGMAASQVLMHIRRLSLTPEINFVCACVVLLSNPIGVPGCLVCSLNARLRSSCTYGRSLSCCFICVCLDVQVHRGGCRPGSNVHTEVESHTRNPLFFGFFHTHTHAHMSE
jgi:hypothetical protein